MGACFLEMTNRKAEQISNYQSWGERREGNGCGYKVAAQGVFVVMEMVFILIIAMSVVLL